jgi:transposase
MAKPLVSDDLWAAVAPLLPPERPKPKAGGRGFQTVRR